MCKNVYITDCTIEWNLKANTDNREIVSLGVGCEGVLHQHLRKGELRRVWNPDPVQDKKILKYTPRLGQQPQFYDPV